MANGRRIVKKARLFFGAYRWWILSVVVFLALLGAGLAGYIFHLKWKLRQSGRLVEQASGYLQERRTTEALMSYETALRLNPGNADALRGMAMLQYSIGQNGAALLNFQQLADSREMTPRDAQVFALLAALHMEWELADRIVDALSAGDPTALPHLISADISTMRGKLISAESSLRQAVDIDASAQCRAALAGFLIANQLDKDNATEIFLLLNELSASESGLGAAALTAGIEKKLVPTELMPDWIAALRAHPERTEAMLLVADGVEVKRSPDRADVIAAGVFERLKGASLEDRKKGVFWLTNHGKHALAVDLVTPDEALGDRDLFGIWLDALAGALRFEELLQVLDHSLNPLEPWQTHLARGRALHLAGRRVEGSASFEEALKATSGSPDDAIKVAAYFIHAGENDLMRRGVRSALGSVDSAPRMFEVLRNVVLTKRDTNVSLQFHEVAMQYGTLGYIHDLQNEIDYCRLILGGEVDARGVARLARDNPYNLRFRLTNALRLFLEGNSIQGTAALIVPGEMPDDAGLRARHDALSVMAFASQGQINKARAAMNGLPAKLLSRQEIDLVQKVLDQAGE